MEDNWKFYTEIDFSNEQIKQYHIDTRDFHCSSNTEKSPKSPDSSTELKYNFENYLHTSDEVKELVTRLFNESGGKVKWRFLKFDNKKFKDGSWRLKYLRIYRLDNGIVVCDSNHAPLDKELLKSKVNQEHLHPH